MRASAPDIARLAHHDCAVAHCPVSNAKLGHGVAPLLSLLESGVRTGLGTDSVAANNRLDLLDEARTVTSLGEIRLTGTAETLANVTVSGGAVSVNGRPLDEAASYRVVTTGFVAAGASPAGSFTDAGRFVLGRATGSSAGRCSSPDCNPTPSAV